MVQAYHRTYGLPITISRCSNNYGPYHFPEKLIPLMIANALNAKPLPVYGKGDLEREGLHMNFVQDNQSSSTKGVLRGLHFQKEFPPQGKAVLLGMIQLLELNGLSW